MTLYTKPCPPHHPRHPPPLQSLLFPLLFSLLLVLTAPPPAAAYTCQTPLTFSENRLPAILQIENVCSDNSVAICLEFDGAVYLIQHMDPSTLYTIPTVLDDCWVFRASNCDGEILLEHQVSGTRKLTVGCTKHATDANALDVATSTPLDCSLTITPKLADVFNATKDLVPVDTLDQLDEQEFADVNEPMQFLNKTDLLTGIFEMCFDLARHGVHTNSSFSIFRHVRAVIWHTESCHSELVGTQIGFPKAYLGLYGAAFANLHASNDLAGTWIENPAPLTQEQDALYHALRDFAVSVDVSLDLPPEAIPTTLHGLPSDGNVAVRFAVKQTSETKKLAPVVRPPGLSGEEICQSAGHGKWVFHKMSGWSVTNSTMDCCSPACFTFGSITRFITRPFVTSCCLSCNMAWCSNTIAARTLAVMQIGEVQLPSISAIALKLPIKIML